MKKFVSVETTIPVTLLVSRKDIHERGLYQAIQATFYDKRYYSDEDSYILAEDVRQLDNKLVAAKFFELPYIDKGEYKYLIGTKPTENLASLKLKGYIPIKSFLHGSIDIDTELIRTGRSFDTVVRRSIAPNYFHISYGHVPSYVVSDLLETYPTTFEPFFPFSYLEDYDFAINSSDGFNVSDISL